MGQALTNNFSTARLGEIEAAWALLREHMPGEAALEWVHLLLAFKANKANGWGTLTFSAGQGIPNDWKVESKVTVRVDSVTRKAQTS